MADYAALIRPTFRWPLNLAALPYFVPKNCSEWTVHGSISQRTTPKGSAVVVLGRKATAYVASNECEAPAYLTVRMGVPASA